VVEERGHGLENDLLPLVGVQLLQSVPECGGVVLPLPERGDAVPTRYGHGDDALPTNNKDIHALLTVLEPWLFISYPLGGLAAHLQLLALDAVAIYNVISMQGPRIELAQPGNRIVGI
jgi:hypothetical protein